MGFNLDANSPSGTMGPSSSGKATMTTTEPRTGSSTPPRGASRSARYVAVGLAIGIVLALAGALIWTKAGGSTSPVVPVPSPDISTSSAPTSTTETPEQKAAAEAEATYRRYIAVLDDTAHSGGKDTASLSTVTISSELIIQTNRAQQFKARDWHSVGQVGISKLSVSKVNLTSDPKTNRVPEVVLETCLDASTAYAVDAEGKSVRPSSAATHTVWSVWVRNYPKQSGFNGWFVARTDSKEVTKC